MKQTKKTLQVYYLLLVALIISPSMIFGQGLPHKMTKNEQKLMPIYLKNLHPKGIVTPPQSAVRTAAEWEEMQGVVISWQSYSSVLTQIVKYSVEQGSVYIVTQDSNYVKSTLTGSNIPLDNVSFINAPSNSVWIRDYGPNNIYTNNVDSLSFVDWVYNRPRPDDDAVSSAIANKLNIPLYQTISEPYKLISTGGNFMSDGFGTAFSSKLVLDENPSLTQDNVKSIAHSFMGINNYILMETLPYDGIHHIDMHMKLLDERTLLVGQYPEGVADGPQIEANLNYILSNYTTVFGTPFKIVRIPMPPDSYGNYPDYWSDYLTYTNSLILNKLVLVPIYGIDMDSIALSIYKNAMPGYNVIGINCNTTIPASGAIHCITHEIGTANPLLMSHNPITSSNQFILNNYITSYLEHRSGVDTAYVYYKTSVDTVFSEIGMIQDIDSAQLWHAVIPIPENDTIIVSYYIRAVANSGKEQVKPITAPIGFWSYNSAGNVNLPPVADAGVDINATENSIVYLDGTKSYDPENNELSYFWSTYFDIVFNNSNTATPSFTCPDINGDTTIMVYLKVSDGELYSNQDTVKINIKNNVGINGVVNSNVWNIYPVPAENNLYINFKNNVPNWVKIVDCQGREVIYQVLNNKFSVYKLDISNLKKGIYIIQGMYKNSIFTKQFLKY